MKRTISWFIACLLLLTQLVPGQVYASNGEERVLTAAKQVTSNEQLCAEEFITEISIDKSRMDNPERSKYDIEFIIDVSGSIDKQWGEVRKNIETLIDSFDNNKDQVGITVFQSGSGKNVTRTIYSLGNNFEQAKKELEKATPSGGTPTALGIKTGTEDLINKKRDDAEKVVILFTDGVPNRDLKNKSIAINKAIQLANEEIIPTKSVSDYIFSIYYDNEANKDNRDRAVSFVKGLAKKEAHFYYLNNTDQIAKIFKDIEEELKDQSVEIFETIAPEFIIDPDSIEGADEVKIKGNQVYFKINRIFEKEDLKIRYVLKRASKETDEGLYPTTTKSYLEYQRHNETEQVTIPAQEGALSRSCVKGSLTIHHKTEDGEEVSPTVVQEPLDLGEYTEKAVQGHPDYRVIGDAEKTLTLTKESPHQSYTFLYAKIKYGEVRTNYIDEETGEKIEPSHVQTGEAGTSYEAPAKEIPDYELVRADGESKGMITEEGTDVTYYYQKIIKGSTIIHYVDEAGKELVNPVASNDLSLGSYHYKAIAIPGYTIISEPDVSLTLTKENPSQEHYFTYKKLITEGSVTAHYLNAETNEPLMQSITLTGEVGTTYETERKEIPGFEFSHVAGNVKGMYGKEHQDIYYYYTVKEEEQGTGNITVYYKDEAGNNIFEPMVYEELPFGDYEQEAVSLYEYELISDRKVTVTLSEETPSQVITFIYRKLQGEVAVHYVDVNTGETIAKSEKMTGYVWDAYQTVAKEIDGYRYIYATGNVAGWIQIEPTVITYYYEKHEPVVNVLGSISIHFLDEFNKPIHKTIVRDQLPLQTYTEHALEIPGYQLISEPQVTVELTKEYPNQGVIFKYKKIGEEKGKLTVHYKDEATNESILSPETQLDEIGKDYTVSAKTIPGYEFSRFEGNQKGNFTKEEQQIIIFYKKKNQTDQSNIPTNQNNQSPTNNHPQTPQVNNQNKIKSTFTSSIQPYSNRTYSTNAGTVSKGKTLPNTSTTIPNILIIGMMILLVGSYVVFRTKKQKM